MTQHATIPLTRPDTGETVEIDEQLAELIEQVWQAGVDTVSCCQDAGDLGAALLTALPHLAEHQAINRGRAYVDFPDPAEAGRFLTAVANAGPRDALYVRMTHWAAPGAWCSTVGWIDDNDADEHLPCDIYPDTLHLSFPATDISEIVARLRRHNAGAPPVLGPTDWSTVEVDDG